MKFLAPSILSADFKNLSQQIRYAEIGGADFIHCDVMDGQFVPNITFGPLIIHAVRDITKLPLDVHLMINQPQNFISQFRKSGADYITVHFEEAIHLHRTLQQIKDCGAKAGIAINPATPPQFLDAVLEFADLVLVMSVNPGFGGQSFIRSSLKKIEYLKNIREERNLDFLIEVDGGVSKDTISEISSAGCDIFVAGSSIFQADNISAAAMELKNLLNKVELL